MELSQRSLQWRSSPPPSLPPFSSPTLLLSLTLWALLSALLPLNITRSISPENMVNTKAVPEAYPLQISIFLQSTYPSASPSDPFLHIPLSPPFISTKSEPRRLSASFLSPDLSRSALVGEINGHKSDYLLSFRRCRSLSTTMDSIFSQIFSSLCIYFYVQPSPVEGPIKTGVFPDEYTQPIFSYLKTMAFSSIPPSDSEMDCDVDVIDDLHDPLLLETLNLTIAGKLISNQRPSVQHLQFFVSRAWNCPNRVEAYELGRGIYSFSFLHETDVQHALDEGPWYIAGGLLVVAPVTPETPIDQMPFSHSYLWVRIHDLPPFGFIDKSYPTAVENALGYLKDMELPDLSGNMARATFNRLPSIRRYLRIRVYINILEPLKKEHQVTARAINGDRREITLRLSYEHLPDVCFRCGMIGHLYTNCSVEGNGMPLPFGEWIRSERFGRIHGQAIGGPRRFGGAGRGRDSHAQPAQTHAPPAVPTTISNNMVQRNYPNSQINAEPLRSFSPSSSNVVGRSSTSQMIQNTSPPGIMPIATQPRPVLAANASSSSPKALLPPKPRVSSKPWPSALIPTPVPLPQAMPHPAASRTCAAPASNLPRGPISTLLYGAVASKSQRPEFQAPGILGGRPVGVLKSGSAMSVAFGSYQSFLKGKELVGANEPWASPQARSPVSPLLNKNILKDLEIIHPAHSPFPASDEVADMVVDISTPAHMPAISIDNKQAKRKLPADVDAELSKKGRQASPSRIAAAAGKISKSPGLDKLAVVACEGVSDSDTTLSLNQ